MNLIDVKKRFLNFLINVATSGKYTGKSEFGLSDYLFRYVLMNFIIIFGIGILAAFAAVNFLNGWYFTSFVCSGTILIDIFAFMLARTKIRLIVPSMIITVFYILMCVLVTWNGKAEGANFLFIFIFPSLAIMLMGKRYGVVLSVILGVLISLEMFVPGLSAFDYPYDFSIRMLVNYSLVLMVMVVIEITRKTKDRIVEAQRETLEKQNEELQYFNNSLKRITNDLFAANEKLSDLSTTDDLTKLNNRRSFFNYLEIIWNQSRRLHLPITVLMIDIDYFKNYNDSQGHLEGDKALVAIAQCMKNHCKRETDFVARFGGEEFVCLLPYIEQADALHFTKELVQNVENMKIPHPMSECSEYVTISAGMARIVPDEHKSYTKLLDDADKALYAAKQSGRNRAVAS